MLRTIILFLCSAALLSAQGIAVSPKSAEVWKTNIEMTGKLEGFYSSTVVFHLPGETTMEADVAESDSSFAYDLELKEGDNEVYIEALNGGSTVYSDTVTYTIQYEIDPEVYASAGVSGSDVTLHASILENPENSTLSFQWVAGNENPTELSLSSAADSVATVSLSGAPDGEYYFYVNVIEPDGDTARAGTFVTVKENTVKAFDIKNDHAAWIDSAVIYGVTPYIFVNRGEYRHITRKIPELASVGINTLWIQPVMDMYGGGQGYDITDYFNIRNDLGPEEDLRAMIAEAKSYGMRVLFDIPINHTSQQHPYVLDWVRNDNSHYYDFFMHEPDDAPYSQHYNKHAWGYLYYFWSDLVIINYNNPEVQKWITEACKYWVEEYGIDGYRFDAIWGVTARTPEFTKELRLALKRIKPDIFLLAEDKASRESVFDERFDAGYDWYPEENWVSQWVWSYDYSPNSNPTIFNSGSQSRRSIYLRNSLTNNGDGYAQNAKILRFLENNDTFHFITHHSLEQTYMGAKLYFSLPGIPLIYNGQMIGKEGHPYETEFLFYNGYSIESRDVAGVYNLYKYLAHLRTGFPALYSDNFSEVSISPQGSNFAYRRWEGDQNIFGLINMGATGQTVTMDLPVGDIDLDSETTYYLTDMFSGDSWSGKPEELAEFTIDIDAYSTTLLSLADTVMNVTGVEEPGIPVVPDEFVLNQNYPNPFNPETTIDYYLPETGKVRLTVYNTLGERVAILVNREESSGAHSVKFSGKNLASGVYLLNMEYGNNFVTKKMILLK